MQEKFAKPAIGAIIERIIDGPDPGDARYHLFLLCGAGQVRERASA